MARACLMLLLVIKLFHPIVNSETIVSLNTNVQSVIYLLGYSQADANHYKSNSFTKAQ